MKWMLLTVCMLSLVSCGQTDYEREQAQREFLYGRPDKTESANDSIECQNFGKTVSAKRKVSVIKYPGVPGVDYVDHSTGMGPSLTCRGAKAIEVCAQICKDITK